MLLNSKDIIIKQFILLDWNVIKYIKKPRYSSDIEFSSIVAQIRKKYEIPYCEAHLRDLARSYSDSNKNLVDEDLCFLQSLTQNIAIGIADNNNNYCLTKYNPNQLFNSIICEKPQKPNIYPDMNPQTIFKVDMEALDQEHPMRSMLEKAGGT